MLCLEDVLFGKAEDTEDGDQHNDRARQENGGASLGKHFGEKVIFRNDEYRKEEYED